MEVEVWDYCREPDMTDSEFVQNALRGSLVLNVTMSDVRTTNGLSEHLKATPIFSQLLVERAYEEQGVQHA